MTNPVQQGYVISSENTKILVVDMSGTSEPSSPPSLTNGIHYYTDEHKEAFSMLSVPASPEVAEPQEFQVRVMQQAWPESRLFPAPGKRDDDESRIFVGVKDLARCGVFSGDWIMVSATNSKKSRLCRVYGVDVLDTVNSNEQM